MKKLIPVLIILQYAHAVYGQKHYRLDDLSQRALELHPVIKSAEAEQKQFQALKRSAIELPKTEVMLMYGQYNSIVNNDHNLTISQTLPFPTVWVGQRNLYKENLVASGLKNEAVKNEILFQVKQLYQQWLYQSSYHALMQRQDSLLSHSVKAATLRYTTGEGTLLEKTAVETQYYEVQNQLRQSEAAKANSRAQLQLLLQLKEPFTIAGEFSALPIPESADNASLTQNPALRLKQQQSVVAFQQKKVERNRALPDITVGYFNQTLIGFQMVNGQERYFGSDKRFDGFIVGLSIPLWAGAYVARVKAAEHNYKATEFEAESFLISLEQEHARAVNELDRTRNTLIYYENSALPNASLLERQSDIAFRSGEIDYATLLLNLRQALTIRINYLQALLDYNQSINRLAYLNGISQ